MADKSGIEWTDATWNPVTGCTKVSQGCKNCYAEREWARIAAPRDRCKPNRYTGRAFTDVACHEDLLDRPLRWQKPRRIFVNSMSDLFHESVPFGFIDKVFAVMALCPRHRFQVLTKRPERMKQYMARLGSSAKILDAAARTMGYTFEHEGQYLCSWPIPNIWLGVSVENQQTWNDRVPILQDIPAEVRWISAEPLIGPIKAMHMDMLGIKWMVVGGESGPEARPMHPKWVRDLRDRCRFNGTDFFFKQWGEWAPHPHPPQPGNYTGAGIFLRSSGELGEQGDWWSGTAQAMDKVGKKAAGRMLDGRTWDEYPA